ncbi:MAG: sodium:solute symporter family protein [Candidatus Omnitrophica bacterium]|nr:sodium:solute symporter family protein [Candidatus Omnitrophota bacterium]
MTDSGAPFTLLDGVVLVVYFLGVTGMGLWVARKVKTSGGYFLGDRKLRWWIMMGQAFGTGTHAEQPVAQTGASFELGFGTIWYQWKNMLITPYYWLMAPWYRRSERTTIGEIIEDRYGRHLAFVYTLFAIAFFVFNQGAMLKGAGKVISIAAGEEVISANGVVVAMTAAFIVYSFFGGLVASAYTDFAQSFLILVLSFLLIPTGLAQVGGFAGMHDSLPENFFQIYNEASGLDAFTIAMLTLNGLVGIVAQPHILSMQATGNTERAGRVGQTYGNFVKRLCTIGWALTGLIVAALVVQQGLHLEDREAAFGFACRHFLAPGFTGLMVACVLAANMSTCSNFMVNTGALFTRNLYLQYVDPQAPDRRLLLVGRLSGLCLTLLGVLFALTVERVLDAFLFTETIAAFMGIMFLGGLLWKRANRAGAWMATISTFAVYYTLNYLAQEELKLVYKWQAEPFAWAMLAGFLSLIVFSLLTKPEDSARIESFFDNMRRTTDEENLPSGAPKPLAAERGQDLILLDLPGWFTAERWSGFFHRYREDLVGFVLAWLTVAFLISLAWGILQIGA